MIQEKNRQRSVYNIVKTMVGMLLLCFIIALSCTSVLASSVADLSMEVSYGYGGVAKMGTTTPIHVYVTNSGKEISGKVQITVSSFTENSNSLGLISNSGLQEKNFMYEKEVVLEGNATSDVFMTIPLASASNQLKITILDEYGDVLAESKLDIETENYSYYIYAGVLSDEASVINYFQNTTIYQYNDYTFKGIILNNSDMPSENYGFQLFNILITNQNQLDALSKQQKAALNNWEKNGGIIINTDSILDKSTISWESAIPDSELKKLDYSYLSYEEWSISYALSNVFMDNKPFFPIYVGVIIVYILAMGPLLYIVLKKLNKRKMFWICEVGGAVLFSIVIILMGSATRLNAPFINYFNILSFNQDSIDDSVYFNIQAPFNNEYKLYLDKAYSVRPIYDKMYTSDPNKVNKLTDYGLGFSSAEAENTITIRNDSAFTKEYFCAEKSEENNTKTYVDVKMNVFEDKVTGSVKNNLDYPIENAAILLYNKVIFLDTIPASSTISLNDMKVYTYNPKFKYGLTDDVVGLKTNKNGMIKEGYMQENQKKTILDFFSEKKFGYYSKDAYLIGFTPEANHLELQLDSAYDAYGMTMLEVPIQVDYAKDNLVYTAYVPIKNEEYSSSGDVMYSDEMILSYNLGKELSDIELYFNDLSYYDKEYYKTFSGHIYFYNRITGLYDPIDLSSKYISANNLKPYLDQENQIVIKYVEQFDKEEKQALLPSLSTIGRVADAEN